MALFGGGGSSDEMKIVVSAETTDAKNKLDELDQSIKKISESGESASSGGLFSAKGAFLGIAAASAATVGAVAALGSTLQSALRVENLTSGFQNLQASIGSDSTSAMESLRKATQGLISDFDLMQSSNQAVLLGVDKGTGEFAKLSAAALKLGSAMGITAKEALDSLVVGIGRGSKLVLDNLGIIVNTEKAYKDYAATIGTTADKLTDAQQKLAFQAAAFDAVSKSAETLAPPADTAALAYQRLTIALENLGSQTAQSVSDNTLLKGVINALGTEIQKLPGEISTWLGWLEKLTKYIANSTLDVLGNFIGQGIALGSVLSDLANGELPNLTKAQTAATAALNKLREAANPTVGALDAFKGQGLVEIFNQEAKAADIFAAKLGSESNDSSLTSGAKKATKKLYELADIGKELSQKILGQDLTQIVEELGQGFGDGAIKADQLTKILENSRDAFIKLGLSAQQADSIIKGIKLTPTPTPNKPGSTTGGTPNLLGDLFGGIFGTPVSPGGSSGTADTAAATFAANLGLQVQNKLSDGIVAAFEGNDIGNSIKGLAGSLASAVATSFGGPIAGSLAQVGVSVAGSIIDQVSAGKQISGSNQAKAALLTGGMSLAVLPAYNAIIGGSKSPEEEARKQIENFLESTLGENVIFGQFEENFANTFSNITGNAQGAFETIGEVIKNLTGVTEEVGAQIGYILADNFGGTIDDLKYLVSDLGLTFEQVQDQMVQAFLAGDQTAQEVISTLAGIEEAFKPGLEGAGQFTKAMDNLIASMGTGKESLKSLKDLAVEFKETGGKTLGEFQNALEASGKYTSAQIQQLFTALSQRGITSLDQLAGASDLTLIGIIADLQTLGFKFADSIGSGVKDSIDDINKLRDTISKLPETVEKNIKINVSTNYSDSQAKGALAQLTGNSSPGIARQ